jgi:hypothetical protein
VTNDRRPENEDSEGRESRSRAIDDEAWDSPAFRRSVLINLAFVAAPAIVMALLGAYAWAAAWFGVGAAIVIFESRRQIRSLWRALRSGCGRE